MIVEFLQECSSTHIYINEAIRAKAITPPYAICAKRQTSGVGSRGNEWVGFEGNLFLSFCIHKDMLPGDLNDASTSIYFSMIMKEYLCSLGSKLWVKWPNDFYLDNSKIGGTISTKIGDIYIGSMGINLVKAPKNRGILDIDVSASSVALGFCDEVEKKILWKQIFSKFKIEFELSKKFITHIGDESVDLSHAKLCEDGAIFINNKKVYSLR